jgi:hypothetical protein
VTTWDGPWHVVLNGLSVGLLLVALTVLVLPSSRPLRRGWKSKVCWGLGLGLGVTLGGFWIPIGPAATLYELRWRRREGARPPTTGTP